jgi:hypothetical protein
MPTHLDDGRRPPKTLLRVVVARLLGRKAEPQGSQVAGEADVISARESDGAHNDESFGPAAIKSPISRDV